MSDACGKQYRREVLQGPPAHNPRASALGLLYFLPSLPRPTEETVSEWPGGFAIGIKERALSYPSYVSVWDSVLGRNTGYA